MPVFNVFTVDTNNSIVDSLKLNPRQPHVDFNYVKSIIRNVERCRYVYYKVGVDEVNYYYDDVTGLYYLIKYDKHQKIYRLIDISQFRFYNELVKQLR
jgi:hypothetical protein